MLKEKSEKNLIVKLSFEFSIAVINYCSILESLNKYAISNQLLKSGTSIGANIREAQNAESKNDFIHKCKIAAKEADETEYWLELCSAVKGFPDPKVLIELLAPIMKIINKIISTSKSFSGSQ